ncbi:MAG: hypothetical protein K2Y71_00885 [Xanthobacteraceae bacterium]|nr:hypothetical protein [Xanthobacteraceae bacterium]
MERGPAAEWNITPAEEFCFRACQKPELLSKALADSDGRSPPGQLSSTGFFRIQFRRPLILLFGSVAVNHGGLMALVYCARGLSGTQIDVMAGDVRIATLWSNKSHPSNKREDWRWTFTMAAGPSGFSVSGATDSKADAQALIASTWERWIAAAGLVEK